MARVLVTGGAGFIGSNFTIKLVKLGYRVRVLDRLGYAGNLENLEAVKDAPGFEFVQGDICDRATVEAAYKGVDKVIHFAAETHIDRSIVDLEPFARTDFWGSFVLLDEFRRHPKERFVHISTSEVYGSAQRMPMDENHPIAPQSPYAATKAGADRLAYSFFKTYGLPIVIVRPFNNYGPYQHPEKLIPFFITSALTDQPLLVYGSGENTRDWLYVEDCCAALLKILELDIASLILEKLGKPDSLRYPVRDRPGHVERLCCDTRQAREILGWEAETKFPEGLERTIRWYQTHQDWWQRIQARPEYQEFYRSWYRLLGYEA
jgi:dTDP-glucose 4,6-dehydratase